VAINNSGQVAGYDGYNRPGLGSEQAYIQSQGVTTQLGVLPGAEESIPAAINNTGQVAGYSEHSFVTNSSGTGVVDAPAGQSWVHAFLYNGSTMVDLGTLGGKESYANALNNHGDVVGMSGILPQLNSGDRNQIYHAFLVPFAGKMIDLGTLPGDTASVAYGINDKGQVVGWSGPSWAYPYQQATNLQSHAFLYQGGQMADLNKLIPPIGVTLTNARAINDQGQVLVTGVDSNGKSADYLLTPAGLPVPPAPVYPEAPVPEPSTLAVLALGLAAWAAKWARLGS
jgi:probable HAF family extracellular repeat protein